ncbi:hypothetical protein C9374_014238 [Naegleria lovaniensis]|uniref:Uncharacterized protein n=1 Tax=Naegleria lovaniensis TaxID=51637 RepID=A0AA88KCT8_NAELO|nr:uncharacterized protein C9374_014238 [Naegleria lovaniensis]KAG2370780.1 hypothetical protein C9374_014238 [Naegleria lovaniensis]
MSFRNLFDSDTTLQLVNLYLNDTSVKESNYAIASLGISSFFLISFMVYLTAFIGFWLTERFRNACTDCTKKEEESNEVNGISKPQVDEMTYSSTNTPNTPYYSGLKKSHTSDGTKTSKINRNQKIMFILVLVLVVVQCFALTSRMISDSMNLTMKEMSLSELNESTVVAFYVFSCAELGLTFGNMITTVMIMCFVQHVFLITCHKVKAISDKTFRGLNISLNIFNVIYFLLSSGIIITISIGLFLLKLNIGRDFLLTIYIMCFVINSSMMILETLLFNIFGYLVIRTINRQSTKTQRDQNKLCAKRKHFAKLIVLQGALSFCALLQLLAVIFQSSAKASKTHGLELAYYFVNSFGILSFAVVVLLLYNPLFNYPANKIKFEDVADYVKEMLQIEPTTPTSPYSPKNSARTDSARNANNFLEVPGASGQYLSVHSESFGGSSSSLDISTSCDSSSQNMEEVHDLKIVDVRIEEVKKMSESTTQIFDSQQ